jgi:hypothetical protein
MQGLRAQMKKLLLFGIAGLFLATGAAHAMQHDFSRTWCACNIPKSALIDREHYYAWTEKCHKRRGTKPLYALPCEPGAEYGQGKICKRWKPPLRDCRNENGLQWFLDELKADTP